MMKMKAPALPETLMANPSPRAGGRPSTYDRQSAQAALHRLQSEGADLSTTGMLRGHLRLYWFLRRTYGTYAHGLRAAGIDPDQVSRRGVRRPGPGADSGQVPVEIVAPHNGHAPQGEPVTVEMVAEPVDTAPARPRLTCPYPDCGHVWTPAQDNPKLCERCQRRLSAQGVGAARNAGRRNERFGRESVVPKHLQKATGQERGGLRSAPRRVAVPEDEDAPSRQVRLQEEEDQRAAAFHRPPRHFGCYPIRDDELW